MERERRREDLGERVRMYEELGARIEASRARVESLRERSFGAILNVLKIRQLRSEIGADEREAVSEKPNLEHARARVETGERNVAELERQLGEPDRILERYYERTKREWAAADVDEGEIRSLCSAEHLSSLDMDSYVLLMRRLPSEMVTHVSRRGVRDHVGMMYHQAGTGEAHDSFDRLLAARELRGALSMKLESDERDAHVARLVGLDGAESREDALAALDRALRAPGFMSLADASAVHVAAEWAADVYYGAESKNEVFVAFPSALIASEYAFSGSVERGVPGEQLRNDTWIWTKESEGIPLDAGVVFLPADARVDPETGSRYRIADGRAVPNHALSRRVLELAGDRAFAEMVVRYADRSFRDRPWDEDLRVREELRNRFGVEDPRVVDLLLGWDVLTAAKELFPDLRGYPSSDPGRPEVERRQRAAEAIDRGMQGRNLHIAEAENTVSSAEFWEAYFRRHPERRPKHTVLYEGGDPTSALVAWREKNGLTRRAGDVGVSFDARRRREEHPGGDHRDVPSAGRFAEIARRLIDERFPDV